MCNDYNTHRFEISKVYVFRSQRWRDQKIQICDGCTILIKCCPPKGKKEYKQIQLLNQII